MVFKLVSNRVIYSMTIFLYNMINKCEILVSHCSVVENESLLEYYAISIGKYLPNFRKGV
jgi:hypothetical protein